MWLLLVGVVLVGIFVGSLQMMREQPVRCPSCTQRQWAPKKAADYNCNRCGTPILRGGEFVQAQGSSQ